MTEKSVPEQLEHINTVLENMPNMVTAAVAVGIKPLCDQVIRHDERIHQLESSVKGLWVLITLGATALIGEVLFLWRLTAGIASGAMK